MTQPAETVVDGDLIDEGRRAWPTVLAFLVLGALVGVLLGGLYGASQPVSYSASSALSVLPDPTIDITDSQNSNSDSVASLDATAYIQSQLIIINGRQLAARVQSELSLPDRPTVTATQVGETYVVQIDVSSTDRSQALATAKAIGSGYDRIRSRQLTSEINGLLSSVRNQLNSVQSTLAASSRGSRTTQLTPSQTALQTQYEQLLSERSALNATLAQVPQIVTVVSPAVIATSGLSSAASDALAGFVIGAILGVVVLVIYRRGVHRVRGISDLAALGVPVLLPVQGRRSLRSQSGPQFWQHPPARLLAARLYADALRAGKALVVVGATSRVGTTTVAASVSAALTGRGPVLLITVRSDEHGVTPILPPTRAASDFSLGDRSTEAPDELSVVDREPVVASNVPGVWLLTHLGGEDARPAHGVAAAGSGPARQSRRLARGGRRRSRPDIRSRGAVGAHRRCRHAGGRPGHVVTGPGAGRDRTVRGRRHDQCRCRSQRRHRAGCGRARVFGRSGSGIRRSLASDHRTGDHQIPADSPLWESLLDDLRR